MTVPCASRTTMSRKRSAERPTSSRSSTVPPTSTRCWPPSFSSIAEVSHGVTKSIATGPVESCHQTCRSSRSRRRRPRRFRSAACARAESDARRRADDSSHVRDANDPAARSASARPCSVKVDQTSRNAAAAEWNVPVMRDRISPCPRGPFPRIQGRRRPGYRSQPRTKCPCPASPLPASYPPSHCTCESVERKAYGSRSRCKGARLHPAARRRRHGLAGRLQGPQARALFLSQGRHPGLHQGSDRVQRA